MKLESIRSTTEPSEASLGSAEVALGAVEHLSVPPQKKVDAGTQLLEALVRAGWERG